MVFVVLLNICTKKNSSTGERGSFEIKKILHEMVIGSHEDYGTKQKMNAAMYRNLRINTEEERIRINKTYMRLELEMHNGLLQETVACMKNNLHSIIFTWICKEKYTNYWKDKK